MTKNEKHRLFEVIAFEDAVDAAEQRDITDDERAAARSFVGQLRARVLESQRAARASKALERVRPSIIAMARDALTARLSQIFELHPGAVFAHRDLTTMSDDDLRLVLEDAETMAQRMV